MSVSHGGKGSDRVGAASEDAADATPSADDEFEILEVVGINETEPLDTAPLAIEPTTSPEEPAAGAAELQEAVRDKERYHDLWLRQQADFENFRKRADRESERLRSGAAADLVRQILPVLDNLERALSTAGAGQPKDPLRRGVELILLQLLEALEKQGLQVVAAVGMPFDPHLHEAVEVQLSAGVEPGTVLEEMQKGYTFQGRLIRPALVKVSSGETLKADDRESATAD